MAGDDKPAAAAVDGNKPDAAGTNDAGSGRRSRRGRPGAGSQNQAETQQQE